MKETTYFIRGNQAPLHKNDSGGYCEFTIIVKDDERLEDDYRYKSFDEIYSITVISNDSNCEDTYTVVTPSVKASVTVVKASSIEEAYAKGKKGGTIEYIEKDINGIVKEENILEKINDGLGNIAHYAELHKRVNESCNIFGLYKMPMTCCLIQTEDDICLKGTLVHKIKTYLNDMTVPLCDISLDERKVLDVKLFKNFSD